MKVQDFFIAATMLVTAAIAFPTFENPEISTNALITAENSKFVHYPVENTLFQKRDFTGDTPTEKALYYLLWLNKDLRGFVKNRTFDHRKFATESDDLRDQLARIDFFVETESVDSPSVEAQIAFSRQMYQAMVETADKKANYMNATYVGASVLEGIFDLNIELLSLYDRGGTPDTKSEDYNARVKDAYCSFMKLGDIFKALNGMVAGMKKLYKNQEVTAMSRLDPLTRETNFHKKGPEICLAN